MNRVRISFPDTVAFQTELAVRVTDINYGGHLANDRLLGLLHEARVRWLESLSLSEADVGDGLALMMVNASIAYQAQAYIGDRLLADLAPADPGRCGFTLLYRLTRVSDQTEIARAFTGLVCFDYHAERLGRLPERLRALCVEV